MTFPGSHSGSRATIFSSPSTPPTPDPARISRADGGTIAILGAGAAGQAAVEELRRLGWSGRLLMVGREPDRPYDRTNLSKMYLSGDFPRDQLPLRPADHYQKLGVERLERTIVRLDVPEKTLHFDDGGALGYDGALMATGGIPRPLSIAGGERALLLRSLADADRIRQRVRQGTRVVILGASFIGVEAASALRDAGAEVSVVAPDAVPFAKQFGPEVGQAIRSLHEEHGVRFFLEDEAVSIGAEGVFLHSPRFVPADLVIAGLGVTPATDFVKGLQLSDDGGIPVDDHLHAGHDLFAAGDVAEFPLPPPIGDGTPVRIEHWRVAMQHGRLAARNLAGLPTSLHDFIPYFWTYHFGERMNYVGHAKEWDEIVFHGRPDRPPCIAYYVRNGKVRAAFCRRMETEAAALHELLRLDRLPCSFLQDPAFNPLAALALVS